jgi:hypothetical protein
MYVCIYVNTCASSGQQPKLAAVLKHVLSSICPGTRANIHPYWDPQGKSLTYTRNPTPWDEIRTICAYKYMLLAHQPGLRDSEGWNIYMYYPVPRPTIDARRTHLGRRMAPDRMRQAAPEATPHIKRAASSTNLLLHHRSICCCSFCNAKSERKWAPLVAHKRSTSNQIRAPLNQNGYGPIVLITNTLALTKRCQ